jgi:hypothetical protein
MDKVALEQVLLLVLLFTHVNIFPPWFSTLTYLGDEPVTGLSSETKSDPMETNNDALKTF